MHKIAKRDVIECLIQSTYCFQPPSSLSLPLQVSEVWDNIVQRDILAVHNAWERGQDFMSTGEGRRKGKGRRNSKEHNTFQARGKRQVVMEDGKIIKGEAIAHRELQRKTL